MSQGTSCTGLLRRVLVQDVRTGAAPWRWAAWPRSGPGQGRSEAANADGVGQRACRPTRCAKPTAGHDGTWVAHPGLIPVAREIFDAALSGPNQLEKMPEAAIGADDLLKPCHGSISREGFNETVEVCVRYLAAWLSGTGCVAIHGLMEDAATAEICRSQLWLWLHRKDLHLSDGTLLCWGLFDAALLALPSKLQAEGIPGQARIGDAIALLERLVRAPELADFLTLPAYEAL
jgi:malate synthase